MEKSKTYCVMPHIGLALQNDGDVCACNLNTLSYKNNERQVMFVHKDSIKDTWHSYTRKILQKSLDSGERIAECKHCWDLEDAGKQSLRQHFNGLFKDIIPNSEQPKVFVLKPGNTCNLSCRMCNPATSSSWYKDAHKMAQKRENFIGTLKEYTKNFESIRNSFSRDNQFWDDFAEWLPNLEYLDVYGGEPFLIDGLFDTIKKVQPSRLENVSIRFHTNAQRINEDYLDLLKDFKSVNIGISIDSHIDEHMEYIRHGCSAETVRANTKKLIEFAKDKTNINLHVQLTVTPLNVFYLGEIIQNLEETGLHINVNYVTGPDEEYDIRHIPLPVKKIITDRINLNPRCKRENETEFLNQTIPGCDIIWPKFWKTTKMLDDIRGQDFQSTFPEFYEVVKDYL
jgi:MoaA/NifB/PqqE/SkfB family radical SAM enzyme